MDKKTFTLEFPFVVDEPTIGGRIYPRTVVAAAIADYQSTMDQGRAFGELGDSGGRVQLSKTSHLITGLRIEGSAIKGDVEALPTEPGKKLTGLHAAEIPLALAPVGSVDIDHETNEVSSFRLHFINIVPDI